MIITSSQQIQDILNPSEQLNMVEFEMITMVFASYICIIKITTKRKKYEI